jgi:hypothetical protein
MTTLPAEEPTLPGYKTAAMVPGIDPLVCAAMVAAIETGTTIEATSAPDSQIWLWSNAGYWWTCDGLKPPQTPEIILGAPTNWASPSTGAAGGLN